MRTKRRDEFADYREIPDEMTVFQPPRFLPHFVFLLIVFGGSLIGIHYFGGPERFRQTVEALATPVGVVWLGLLLAAYWVTVWRIRLGILLCWTCWLVLTLAGSSFFSNRLVEGLESPYVQIDPFEKDKLDAILVLGGGTDTTPKGIPQFGASGDRLALAARLYHAGKVDKIIVAGLRQETLYENELQLHDESARILESLNVPAANIVQLPEGTDTSGEIQAVKTWMTDQSIARVGILSSAWHMKRAMILAKRYEVNATPLPANFLSESVRPGPGVVIPSAWNLYVSQLAIREYLGRWFDK